MVPVPETPELPKIHISRNQYSQIANILKLHRNEIIAAKAEIEYYLDWIKKTKDLKGFNPNMSPIILKFLFP